MAVADRTRTVTDPTFLKEEAYADDANLAARQALWSFRDSEFDIFQWTLDLAALSGDERFLDIGCGNGLYLAALAGRGHRGPIHAFDLSEGMARTAQGWNTGSLGVADAQMLPLRDRFADVVLAAHMLYHVPDQRKAAAEMRRVLRRDGLAIAITNSRDSLAELDALWVQAAKDVAGVDVPRVGEMLSFVLENGGDVLASAFDSVERVDVHGTVTIPDVDVITNYIASMRGVELLLPDGTDWNDIVASVREQATRIVEQRGALRADTLMGAFLCR